MVDASVRIYAIGDIHGRLDLLETLLEKIRRDEQDHKDERSTRLVFLGDYIDRGDASRGVVECLLELEQAPHVSTTFLKGNHEVAMLRFLKNPILEASWLRFGGLQTLASFGISSRTAKPTEGDILLMHHEFCSSVRPLLPFFEGLENECSSGDYFFCHAGVDPDSTLSHQTEKTLVWGHPQAILDQPIPGKKIVHGHFDDVEIDNKIGRVCIDTGAYYSGVLTALKLDKTEQIIQAERR